MAVPTATPMAIQIPSFMRPSLPSPSQGHLAHVSTMPPRRRRRPLSSRGLMSIVRAAPQGERRLKPISRRSPYLLIASCVAIVALVALGGSATVAAADLAPNDLELLERAARLGASGQQDAERRGEALDVDALRAMFERGEVELAARFARGMRKSAHVSLPPAVERLLVERFEQRKLVDAVLGARLEYRS